MAGTTAFVWVLLAAAVVAVVGVLARGWTSCGCGHGPGSERTSPDRCPRASGYGPSTWAVGGPLSCSGGVLGAHSSDAAVRAWVVHYDLCSFDHMKECYVFSRSRLAAAAVAVTGVVALSACSSSSGSSDGAKGTPSESSPAASSAVATHAAAPADPATRDVRITKAGFVDDEVYGAHAYVVHYTITNHGPGPANYFVGLDFRDKDGDHLGGTGVTADQLGVGKSKTDRTAPLDVEIQNGKISDIRSVRVSEVQRTAPTS